MLYYYIKAINNKITIEKVELLTASLFINNWSQYYTEVDKLWVDNTAEGYNCVENIFIQSLCGKYYSLMLKT